MRKIFSGFLGLALVVAVVVGTAYALFFDNATVSGLNITSATADLLINGQQDLALSGGGATENIFPGYGVSEDKHATFNLTNNSNGDFGLDISASLTSAPGNWNELKDVIQLRVIDQSNNYDTGWRRLSEWYNGNIALTSNSIARGDTRNFEGYVRMPYDYPLGGGPIGNALENKTLTGVTFVITGTQHQ
ncbi:hypothetical protein M1563_01910 [Patescibacteria group bacterium]|nr:hypothetical protein [Patescibacteria group bacterium]